MGKLEKLSRYFSSMSKGGPTEARQPKIDPERKAELQETQRAIPASPESLLREQVIQLLAMHACIMGKDPKHMVCPCGSIVNIGDCCRFTSAYRFGLSDSMTQLLSKVEPVAHILKTQLPTPLFNSSVQ
jgi:hypothetical protein